MLPENLTREEELLCRIAADILYATDDLAAGRRMEEDLPTAAELAKKYNARLENVKKRIRALKQEGLIHPISVSPKRYRFDRYALNHLDEESPLGRLFLDEDSAYYIH